MSDSEYPQMGDSERGMIAHENEKQCVRMVERERERSRRRKKKEREESRRASLLNVESSQPNSFTAINAA